MQRGSVYLSIPTGTSGHLKTREMSNETVRRETYTLWHVPDQFRAQEMCNDAVEEDPYALKFFPDPLKTQKMCDKAVKDDPYSLQFVPDWFVTQQQLKIWPNQDDYCNNDEPIEWYEDHKGRKAQKAKMKEELLPIAWHPSHWWDWCMSEEEKKETEKLFLTT